MTRPFYTVAKTLSNFAVLGTMLAILAVAAVIIQLTKAENTHLQLFTLLAPFLWVGVPAIMFTAAVAVLFETVPGLRGGFGNVFYFFAWAAALGLGVENHMDDVSGFTVIGRNMQSTLQALDPTYKDGISLTLESNGPPTSKVFLWNGVHWTAQVVLHRFIWVGVAVALALVAAEFFHRFDPARTWAWHFRKSMRPQSNSNEENGIGMVAQDAPVVPSGIHLTPLPFEEKSTRFGTVLVSELRLLLNGRRWWWYAAAAIMIVLQAALPTSDGRQGALIAAWIWPVLLWSQMGMRETRYGTGALIFSAPRALERQLPALWAAGVTLTAITGSGFLLRTFVGGDFRALMSWAGAALFIPSLALALGVWSGTSKLFEAIYTIWWYVGPLHHTPGIDFMNLNGHVRNTAYYAAASGVLIMAAFLGRRAKMAYA
jgi:hypothetical protein